MRLGYFRHEDNSRRRSVNVEFRRCSGGDGEYISAKLDYGELETEADSEEGDFLVPGVFNCEKHASGAATAKAAWDEDATGRERKYM